jgi:hypothetical protein
MVAAASPLHLIDALAGELWRLAQIRGDNFIWKFGKS